MDQQCTRPCQRFRRRLNDGHGSIWPTRSPSARNPRRSRQLNEITGKVVLDAFLPCVYPLPSSSASDSWLVLVSMLSPPRWRRLNRKHGCLDPTADQGKAALWCQRIASRETTVRSPAIPRSKTLQERPLPSLTTTHSPTDQPCLRPVASVDPSFCSSTPQSNK